MTRSARRVLAFVVIALAAIAFVAGAEAWAMHVVASRVRALGDQNGLSIHYAGALVTPFRIVLHDVTIAPRDVGEGEPASMHAPRVEIGLSRLSPSSVTVVRPAIVLRTGEAAGAAAAVLSGITAAKGIVNDPTLPIAIEAGTLEYVEPFGEGTSLRFEHASFALRPDQESLVQGRLRDGKLVFRGGWVGPLQLDFRRNLQGGDRLVLDLALESTGKATTSRMAMTPARDRIDLAFEHVPLAMVHVDPYGPLGLRGLDLSHAFVDGRLAFVRDAAGLGSTGDLALAGAKLPPIEAPPLTLSLGDRAAVKWRAVPGRDRGAMHLVEGSVDLQPMGMPLHAALGGDVALGRDLLGPYAADLTLRTDAIGCGTVVPGADGTARVDIEWRGGAIAQKGVQATLEDGCTAMPSAVGETRPASGGSAIGGGPTP